MNYTDQSPLAQSQLWHGRFGAVPIFEHPIYSVFAPAFPDGFLLPKSNLRRDDGDPTSKREIKQRQRPRAGPPHLQQEQSVEFNKQTHSSINSGDYQ